jgi:predicted nucleic acid-binding protein
MKLYLDTNIIIGWFKRRIQSKKNGEDFQTPAVMEFLASQEDIELIVSNLTKTEVYRYLKSDWESPEDYSKEAWDIFIKTFKLEYIEVHVTPGNINNLSTLCLKNHTKKNTLTNLLHLEVAKNYGLNFLTGEKDLSERYGKHYGNILTYLELRQKLS